MPRFCANISMLFKEVEFPERFEAAARAGFNAVEIQFPYTWEKGRLAQIAQHAGVEVVLINIPAGDSEKGDRGIACLPSRIPEFRDSVAKAIEYSKALGCKQMNCLAGVTPARQFICLQPSALEYSIAFATLSRNSGMREGKQAIPRSPFSESPAGMLMSTTSTPACCAICASRPFSQV